MWLPSSHRRAVDLRRLIAQHKATPEMLCRVLRRDTDPEVWIAAAETLALIGDEEALPALRESLQSYFVRRSGRWHLASGLLAAGGALGLLIACLLLQPVIGLWLQQAGLSFLAGALILVALVAVPYYSQYQTRRRKALCAISHAILRITERTRSAEARGVLQHLRATAADYLQCDEETRSVTRRVAEQIDALTRHLDKLPLPAGSPLTPDALPRPSQPAPAPLETLPRVGA